MSGPGSEADHVVDAVRRACASLPEAREQQAWTGTRWRVGGRTFAHVLEIDDGWPPAYAAASSCDGPVTVLMVRSDGPELEALRHGGPPFFPTPWRADEIGMIVDEHTDREELSELVIESYCTQAPERLVRLVRRP